MEGLSVQPVGASHWSPQDGAGFELALWLDSCYTFLVRISVEPLVWCESQKTMSCSWQYYSLRWVSLLDRVSWEGFNFSEEVSGRKPSPADKIGWLWTTSRNKVEMFALSRSCLHMEGMPCTLSQWHGSDQQSLGTACGSKVTCVTMKVAKQERWENELLRFSFLLFPFFLFFFLLKQTCKSEW